VTLLKLNITVSNQHIHTKQLQKLKEHLVTASRVIQAEILVLYQFTTLCYITLHYFTFFNVA